MKLKILTSISLIYLFFSCASNSKVTTSAKQVPSSETKDFSITYPKTWTKIENQCFTTFTIAPKKETSKAFLAENGKLPSCFKGMSPQEIKNSKIKLGVDMPKVKMQINSIALNDTLSFKKFIDNQLKPAQKKDYRITHSKKELYKKTDEYAIISSVKSFKSNKYPLNSLKHYILNDTKVYIISYSGNSNIFSKYIDDFSTILSSFKIKDKNVQ